MKKLIVLSGVPGSGKSYFSNTLKKVRGSHVYIVSSDEKRKEMLGDQKNMSEDRLMWKMYYEWPKVYALDENAIVVLDATNITKEHRLIPVKKFKDLYDKIDLVYYKINREIVENQNIQRDFPVPPDVLDQFFRKFEDPDEEEKLAFDNIYKVDSEDIAWVVKKILEK